MLASVSDLTEGDFLLTDKSSGCSVKLDTGGDDSITGAAWCACTEFTNMPPGDVTSGCRMTVAGMLNGIPDAIAIAAATCDRDISADATIDDILAADIGDMPPTGDMAICCCPASSAISWGDAAYTDAAP